MSVNPGQTVALAAPPVDAAFLRGLAVVAAAAVAAQAAARARQAAQAALVAERA
ncbi:hypothetical protein [Bosea sp. BK604]|uniref:hypothetical protein n=1 Tax=Bosea sp. BK604 TaxID=2512180 RepID=UPI001404FF6A|nr:hypothetical protein [Bosea sp. BK604]